MSNGSVSNVDALERSLLDLAVEGWRFAKLFSRAIAKMDAGEAARYSNQHRFFLKRLEESLNDTGARLVNLEGQAYDPGMAATALNIGEFGPEDQLFIDQMVEPVILNEAGLLRTGTVLLRKSII